MISCFDKVSLLYYQSDKNLKLGNCAWFLAFLHILNHIHWKCYYAYFIPHTFPGMGLYGCTIKSWVCQSHKPVLCKVLPLMVSSLKFVRAKRVIQMYLIQEPHIIANMRRGKILCLKLLQSQISRRKKYCPDIYVGDVWPWGSPRQFRSCYTFVCCNMTWKFKPLFEFTLCFSV